jgi:hypothetical protein
VDHTPILLDQETAVRFARIALGHVTREYPNKLDHVFATAEDVQSPRALHPIFYGSFDWHSCVHSYWLLVSLHRRFRFDDLPTAPQFRELIAAHFTAENVAAELAYLARPLSRTFERPYGWAWLLKLSAELYHSEFSLPEGRHWRTTFDPLANAFADRFLDFLPRATYPVRNGVHSNSAFALTLALDFAQAAKHRELETLIIDKACAWFENDSDCEAWEPSGDDFLSPTLVEVWLMMRVFAAADRQRDFLPWLERFLPHLEIGAPTTLFTPATVSDPTDGKIAHLDGLNFSRAACFRRLLRVLPAEDRRRERLEMATWMHLDASMKNLDRDYMGEHWLATYALLALTDD